MHPRLPVTVPQIKAGNTSENIIIEFQKVIYNPLVMKKF